jgi:hypothetical protein
LQPVATHDTVDDDIGVARGQLGGQPWQVLRRLPAIMLVWQSKAIGSTRPTEDNFMPKMSDSRRKRIQAKQRKATNALQRAAKAAKRSRNSAKTGTTAG